MPPLIPAAKFRPTRPRMTARPPVMYSQPVVTDPLDNRMGAAVTHAEPFAGDATDKGLSLRRAVERDVPNDDVVLGDKRRARRRKNREMTTRQAFAKVVVGVALDGQGNALWNESPETLPSRPPETKRGSCPAADRHRPNRRVSSCPSIVPTVRLTLRTGSSISTGTPHSSAS